MSAFLSSPDTINALATYWFGFKEGFFSGVVHLACVITAGALAFAFWEPLAHVLLGVPAMKEWAWGVSLLLLFSLLLLGPIRRRAHVKR